MKTFKDIKALRELDAEALEKERRKAEFDCFALRQKKAANELKQPHLIRVHRRYIARIRTVQNEIA